MDIWKTYHASFEKTLTSVLPWIEDTVLTWDMLLQTTFLSVIFLLSSFLASGTARWIDTKFTADQPRRYLVNIHASTREIFLLLYFSAGLWLSVAFVNAGGYSFALLNVIASLATAWGIIRLTSSTIASSFWAKTVAVLLWILAALNIVGWLTPAVVLLSKASFTIGEFQVSLLIIFKSIAAIFLLIWIIGLVSRLLERSFQKARGLTPSQQVLFFKLSNIVLYVVAGLVGLNIVGLDLKALTVFSGALGLGIGFGLQKVFSNLISGIILLMDKSVKPGDVIVVGKTYGWVNSLGARCVSVLTRDGKEHLIPNETLISQEVENWSYSNQHIRIHIPIGVAYHSDVHLVKRLLLESVEGHPRILKTPRPVCFITGFDDNAISYQLRAWIADPAAGITNVRSDIYFRIWDLFKENGIDIPFPQRDVHIKVKDLESILPPRTTDKNTASD